MHKSCFARLTSVLSCSVKKVKSEKKEREENLILIVVSKSPCASFILLLLLDSWHHAKQAEVVVFMQFPRKRIIIIIFSICLLFLTKGKRSRSRRDFGWWLERKRFHFQERPHPVFFFFTCLLHLWSTINWIHFVCQYDSSPDFPESESSVMSYIQVIRIALHDVVWLNGQNVATAQEKHLRWRSSPSCLHTQVHTTGSLSKLTALIQFIRKT